jgi:NADP-dependent 3-hydroxy acid dehydrogenase YdfG
MPKTIIIVGFGPGVSTAVANKFGAEGFDIALVARSQERLDAGVSMLEAKGVTAAAFLADAADPASVREVIKKIRASFGSITVILWNAFGDHQARDFLSVDIATVLSVFDIGIAGLVSAVQEALPDLKAAGDGAVLVTNGAAGDVDPRVDEYVVNYLKDMGLGLANAAKHKLVGMLAQRLKGEGVHVVEVTIAGAIKGTPTGDENSIESSAVADMFWKLYQGRDEIRGRVTDPRL